MKYKFPNLPYKKEPINITKDTPKHILQYAISGLLYMPATQTNIVDKIINNKIDLKAFCLDLEDSLGDSLEEKAILNIKSILSKLSNIEDLPLIFIRVRNSKQIKTVFNILGEDLLKLITGFNFPKFDTNNSSEYIKNFKEVKDSIDRPLYFMPIFESEKIMNKTTRLEELNHLYTVLKAVEDDVLNIRVGATDFSNIYGLRRKSHQTIYDIKVIADCFSDIINIFGKDFVLSGCVWEYFNDTKGLQKELELDMLNGFIGKTAIHPSQLETIAKNNIVSEEDYQDSIKILEMDKEVTGVVKSFSGNKMNEGKTHSNWATKIISLAEIYGVV